MGIMVKHYSTPGDIATQLSAHLMDYIKGHKLRNTPERLEILDTALDLEKDAQVFNAQMLYTHHSNRGYAASKNSIYNTLSLFENASLLVRLPETILGAGSNYCFSYRTDGNIILSCKKCGMFSLFKRKRELTLIRNLMPPRFKVNNSLVILSGECNKCVNKKIKQQK